MFWRFICPRNGVLGVSWTNKRCLFVHEMVFWVFRGRISGALPHPHAVAVGDVGGGQGGVRLLVALAADGGGTLSAARVAAVGAYHAVAGGQVPVRAHGRFAVKFQSIRRSRRSRQRYLRVSWTRMPLRKRSDSRLGMAISAFMQSARFQTTVRFMMLPTKRATM